MPAPVLLGLSVLAAMAAALLPLRWAFLVLVAGEVLIPATLVVPNDGVSALTVERLILLGVAANLVVRRQRGELPAGLARPGRTHAAWAGWLLVAVVTGGLLATPGVPLDGTWRSLLGIFEQFAFFAVALACARVLDDHTILRTLGGVLVVSAGIGILEHVTRASFGHFLFAGVPSQQATDAAAPLQPHGGGVRVRAGAEFALQFAWISAALLPALLVAPLRRRRTGGPPGAFALGWRFVAVLAVLAAVYWSYTRSVLAAGVVIAVVLAVGVWDRRAGLPALGVLLAGAAVGLGVASVRAHFALDLSASTGPTGIRLQRLPIVLSVASATPWHGIGLAGLNSVGIPTTDSTWLRVYAETGTLGLAALLVVLGTGLAAAARGLLAPSAAARALPAAAVAGMCCLLVSAFAFDTFTLENSGLLYWLLAAVAIASAERSLGPARAGWSSAGERAAGAGTCAAPDAPLVPDAPFVPDAPGAPARGDLVAPRRHSSRPARFQVHRRRGVRRLRRSAATTAISAAVAGGLLGGLVGVGVAAWTPSHVAQGYLLETLAASSEEGSSSPYAMGTELINTACGLLAAAPPHVPGAGLTCHNPYTAPGVAVLRAQAPTRRRLGEEVGAAADELSRDTALPGLLVLPLGVPQAGKPAALATAPGWLAIFGAALGGLWPWRRRPGG